MNAPEGSVLFATDTGRMYMIANGYRIALGGEGGGAALLYGEAEQKEISDQGFYELLLSELEDSTVLPAKGDLILNSDGAFYKVASYDPESQIIYCKLLTVSGTGGGGGGGQTSLAKKIAVDVSNESGISTLINGQDAFAAITVTSGTDYNGTLLDRGATMWVDLTLQIQNEDKSYTTYYTWTKYDVADGDTFRFNFGQYARQSATSRLMVVAHGNNSGDSLSQYLGPFTMSDLTLNLTENFKASIGTVFRNTDITLACNAAGKMDRIVDFYWDGDLIDSTQLSATNTTGANVTCQVHRKVEDITHGNHTVRIELHQYILGERKLGPAPIEFEIGVAVVGEEDPVVWLGDYQSEYFNYDDIEIPYYVYDPNPENYTVTVNLYKDNILNGTRIFNDVSGTIGSSYEIVDFDEDEGIQNHYSIGCKKTIRDVYFTIVDDPDRDMTLQELPSLVLSFDSKGRSNDESATNRQKWSYGNIVGSFNNFNWYNNGWIKTNEGTALRISNGASFSIPVGAMTFGGSQQGQQAHTIELQFKVRNVQTYENLISNITRYKGDEDYYDAFYGHTAFIPDPGNSYSSIYTYYKKVDNNYIKLKDIVDAATYNANEDVKYVGTDEGYKTEYTNYDAFLQHYAPSFGTDYDTVTKDYDYTQKVFNLHALVCSFYSGTDKIPIGIGLGPQDAFFTNGTNTVNVSYVEDKMVNLAITYSNTGLMSIYLNGVLTGVVYSTLDGAFKINTDNIVFNSTYCDIDLYKLRVYNIDLSINEVVTNYAVDLKDVVMYDQNTLVDANDKTLFDFNQMIEYNTNHPSDPIMPYIVFETTRDGSEDRLSWSKKTTVPIKVEFVNTVLDRAYNSGELELLAQQDGVTVEDYYLHHCPSWTGEGIEMKVQGTSSEFYPRRNYKLKCKGLMNAHKGPFLSESRKIDWFYMNNYSVGTTKFTMKIDFMESSGSYNRGLGNLVHNAYSHHPLWYYNQAGALTKQASTYTEVAANAEFDPNENYYYINHKGNWKIAKNGNDEHDAKADNSDGLTVANVVDLRSGPVALGTAQNITKVSSDTANQYYNKFYTSVTTYENVNVENEFNLNDLRTCIAGFPVLAFHKKSDGSYTYIGRYNMLLDKGSDEAYGYKFDYYLKYLKNKAVKKKAECWEFENNSRGFCSFRDPKNRRVLSFNTGDFLDSETSTAPSVVDDFEYRYHTAADSLDTISGADSTRMNALTADQIALIKDETGVEVTNIEKGQDLIFDLYGNWEKAVAWVWSTALDVSFNDGTSVLKEADIELLEPEEKAKYLLRRYEKVASGAEYDANETYYVYSRHLYQPYTFVDAETFAADVADGKLYTYNVFTKQFAEGEKTYEYDSYEYRFDKFKYEVTDHFNLDYLLTYFVVTETLECYDSRGKNAMFASWGPMTEGGEYIWFPTFYDMDTQLGINNTGIPSFEFSVDATKEGSFSTNDSVLWNNIYTVFRNQIVQKYKQLKGETEGLGTFEPLSYAPFASVTRIEGWYESDPTICGQIVMRGQRPLSAINLDEYFKYIAITTKAGGGYQNRDGGISYDNSDIQNGNGSPTGAYFYALQGDRSLSRQQFLANRINYLDSWLTVGNYARGGQNAFWGRISANDMYEDGGVIKTNNLKSDVWVEDASIGIDSPFYSEYYDGLGNKKNEFDAEYWITVTPSRRAYVTLGDDAENYPSVQFLNNPVKYNITKLENGIRTSLNYKEQLFYVYGVETMKSLGNLHNLYFTELHFQTNANKLTDFIVGWDGLDTNNQKWFNYQTNRYELSVMPLLQEANFSNIQYKTGVDTVLDLTASEKLQNFRATGSNFTQIKFAEGVALNTLYLPSTITELNLTEARQLTNIITNYQTPTKNPTTGKLVAAPGLYIEKFTDYLGRIGTSNYLTDCQNIVTNLQKISILNAYNLGYDSYKLVNGFYQKTKSNTANTFRIALTDVLWSPYKLVDEGTVYDPEVEYYLDNYHYGLTRYNYNPATDFETENGIRVKEGNEWNSHIKNGELYYYDTTEATNKTMIKDLEMLLAFMNSNNYVGTAENSGIPNITGLIYIDNDTAEGLKTLDGTTVIDEYYVRNVLQPQYPGLKFFFANLTNNYTARFVLLDEDNDKLYTLIGTQTVREGRFTNPITAYGDISDTKDEYDFYGWSSDAEGNTILVNVDTGDTAINIWNTSNTTLAVSGTSTYTFYAIFSVHKYIMTFVDGNGNSVTKAIVSGERLTAPDNYLPPKDDSELGKNEAGEEQTYRFIGWSLSETGTVINLANYKSDKDRRLYAQYEEISVYENPISMEYFNVRQVNYNQQYNPQDPDASYYITGYEITPKMRGILSGKITIPNEITVNGTTLPVILLGTSSSEAGQWQGATKIFFENPKTHQLRGIIDSAFSGSTTLQYFEIPSNLRYIGASAFQSIRTLAIPEFTKAPIYRIGDYAFNGSLTSDTLDLNNREELNISLGGDVIYLGQGSFSNAYGGGYFRAYGTFTIGSNDNPSKLTAPVNLPISRNNGDYSQIHTLTIYCGDRITEFSNNNVLWAAQEAGGSAVWFYLRSGDTNYTAKVNLIDASGTTH